MKRFIQLTVISALFMQCEKEIDLELRNTAPRVVIEGIITDAEGPYTVLVSETFDYFNNSPESGVSGAEVVISDNEGFSETLEETGKGIYQTKNLQGKVGNTYTLRVNYNENDYEASGTILQPAVFDSLTYRFVEETSLKDEGYYLYFFGKTPKPGISYYRWLVYKNGELFNTEPEDFLLASDEFVNEELDDLEFPFAFQLQDTLRLEMYSLEQSVYDYYNELLTILFNDGGLFSPPPVNPVSNIKNLTDPQLPPLGYFQVSPVVAEEVIILDEK